MAGQSDPAIVALGISADTMLLLLVGAICDPVIDVMYDFHIPHGGVSPLLLKIMTHYLLLLCP
jgi:hypothetical protein